MKKITKVLALMMCVALFIGCLTGCGGKSEEEILMSAVTGINNAESSEIEASMTGKMSMKMGEESQDLDMKMDIKGTMFQDPLKMKMTGSVSAMGQSSLMESYIQKENEKYVIYSKVDGTWTKMELGDLDTALASSGMDSFSNQLSADIGKYTKKEEKKEGETTYNVYDYTINGEEMKSMLEGSTSSVKSMLGDSVDTKEYEDLMNRVASSIGNVTLTVYVDVKKQEISRVEYPMTDMMNKMFDEIMKYIKEKALEEVTEDEAKEVKEMMDSMEMKVSDMNMSISYKNVNKAEDFKIPDEALKAKTINDALSSVE
ncbi:MAG: hypothetical protein HFG34_03985 [Eubacterium sp.]|nr:hypothetical protein [Eubacterium sp.]